MSKMTRKDIDTLLWLAEQQRAAADKAWNEALEAAINAVSDVPCTGDAVDNKWTSMDLIRALKREAK